MGLDSVHIMQYEGAVLCRIIKGASHKRQLWHIQRLCLMGGGSTSKTSHIRRMGVPRPLVHRSHLSMWRPVAASFSRSRYARSPKMWGVLEVGAPT